MKKYLFAGAALAAVAAVTILDTPEDYKTAPETDSQESGINEVPQTLQYYLQNARSIVDNGKPVRLVSKQDAICTPEGVVHDGTGGGVVGIETQVTKDGKFCDASVGSDTLRFHAPSPRP